MYTILFQRLQINLQSLFITTSLQLVATLNAYSQPISLSTKEEFLAIHKQRFEDTLYKRTDIDYPFVIGRLHNLITDNFNHPYFKDNKWANGSIVYKGRTYTVRGIKYDIENDKLIYLMYTHDYKMNSIALDENFISGFSIFNTTFKYYNGLKNNQGAELKDGYYEVVFDGKLKFLVHPQKTQTLDYTSSMMYYKTSVALFLLKNGKLISVNNMSKLINQLKDKKKEVKKFVRDNYLKLNQTDYTSASRVLEFYESTQK